MRKVKKSEKKHIVGGATVGGPLDHGGLQEPVTNNRMLRWPRPWDIDPKG